MSDIVGCVPCLEHAQEQGWGVADRTDLDNGRISLEDLHAHLVEFHGNGHA